MTHTYLIAGGGTGGHIFPALAIARCLIGGQEDCRVIFVGTRYGLEGRLIPRQGFRLLTLPMRGLLGKTKRQKLAMLWRLPLSLMLSFWHLLRLRPHAVIGVGGYASLPMVLMAAVLRFPTMIQEQNAYPGVTNRLLSRFAKVACLGFEQAADKLRCPSAVTGNPVRREFFEVPPWHAERKTILVLGGSQGAQILNEWMPRLLGQALVGDASRKIVHQAGPDDVDATRERYEKAAIPAQVIAFVDDVPVLLRDTLLIICRAGASTVSELMAAGVPAVLVPFSKATHDHQTHNAMSLVETGGGIMIPEDQLPSSGAVFAQLLTDPKRLAQMADAFDQRPKDSAKACVDIIRALEAKTPITQYLKEQHQHVSED